MRKAAPTPDVPDEGVNIQDQITALARRHRDQARTRCKTSRSPKRIAPEDEEGSDTGTKDRKRTRKCEHSEDDDAEAAPARKRSRKVVRFAHPDAHSSPKSSSDRNADEDESDGTRTAQGGHPSVESFVATIEAHRSVMCWHDSTAIKVMCLHCKGNASAFGWRHVNDKGSLEEVVQALRNTFAPRRPDAFSWLSECVQAEDATMALYAQTFLQRYEQCCRGEVSEVAATRIFIDGIRDERVQELTRDSNPTTLTAAFQRAQTAEMTTLDQRLQQALQAFSARLEHVEQTMNRRPVEEMTGSRTEGVLQKTNDVTPQTLANDPAFVLSAYLNGKALADAQEAAPTTARPRAQPAPEVRV
eukprot:m51a1_g932 hypothetical protein (359) ;mRNA; r:226154-228001